MLTIRGIAYRLGMLKPRRIFPALIPSIGIVASPLAVHPSIYVIATNVACFEAHVSAFARLGSGYWNSKVENIFINDRAVRTRNETGEANKRGKG